jgi:23S rRNA U2552 (ribose-2'-O)-methylase RlmE/FtsJ
MLLVNANMAVTSRSSAVPARQEGLDWVCFLSRTTRIDAATAIVQQDRIQRNLIQVQTVSHINHKQDKANIALTIAALSSQSPSKQEDLRLLIPATATTQLRSNAECRQDHRGVPSSELGGVPHPGRSTPGSQLSMQDPRQSSKLTNQVSSNPKAGIYFKQQRQNADALSDPSSSPEIKSAAKGFYTMMQNIGTELNEVTGAFNLSVSPKKHSAILDMCMAPGGFLSTALQYNQSTQAVAFTLPIENGGHEVFLPENDMVLTKYFDITMLAADMGIEQLPNEHAGLSTFIMKRQIPDSYLFDLVLCDGHVLRTHHRPASRETREARRLLTVQLALGLEHLKPGGTTVIRLHKIDKMLTAELIYQFSRFSQIKLFKPTCGHNMRSSFYMVASDIWTDREEVASSVQKWKEEWRIATFGTDAEYENMMLRDESSAKDLLKNYGEQLVEMGKKVWRIQSEALANAPFMKEAADMSFDA